MIHFVTASKDSTIYLQQPEQNTGRDEILEVSKVYYGNVKDISRALIYFDLQSISESIHAGNISLESVDLILREAESITSKEIPIDFTLYAYPLSQSWDMGLGTRFDEISSDGVTWNQRGNGLDWLEGDYVADTTGSINGRGGVWVTSVSGTEDYSYNKEDVYMDIRNIVLEWISGSLENNGLILKYDNSLEDDIHDYGELKFFSKETNTIYQPKLRIGWDSAEFNTGSLTELDAEDINISYKRLKTKYKVGSTVRIGVFGRDVYPLKNYSNLYGYTDVKYLPATTYYQIRDAVTDEIIIPFSIYSKVSCNANGNYIEINFENWEINRDYYLELKVERNGEVLYFSNKNQTFEIVE
mgnify:CR=1 FL=1